MAQTLLLTVVTPAGSVLHEPVVSVVSRSDVGEFCVLPEHRPMLSSIVPGRLVLERPGGEKAVYAIDTGFFEGGPAHANIMTARCVAARDLDEASILSDIEALQADMDAGTGDMVELEQSLRWATACLDVARSCQASAAV